VQVLTQFLHRSPQFASEPPHTGDDDPCGDVDEGLRVHVRPRRLELRLPLAED